MSDTIVSRLTTQRTLLVDVVRQIDQAIALFGGAPQATNGNGHTAPTKAAPRHKKAAPRRKKFHRRWRTVPESVVAAARAIYETEPVTLAHIGKRVGLSQPVVSAYARKQGWVRAHGFSQAVA